MTPPLITLEEHWYSGVVFNSFDSPMKRKFGDWPGLLDKLFDANEIRLKDMDQGNIALQVISHCLSEDPSPSVCQGEMTSSQRRSTNQCRRKSDSPHSLYSPRRARSGCG
uniref:Uncharacterized protein n=1 Tax=Bionectria ochroleuca TaxID=29856 RepID=A0A8H7K1A5_BIOOC